MKFRLWHSALWLVVHGTGDVWECTPRSKRRHEAAVDEAGGLVDTGTGDVPPHGPRSLGRGDADVLCSIVDSLWVLA